MNNTNLANGGEPIHPIIEPYQTTKNSAWGNKNTWAKQQTQNRQEQQIRSNYSGHHVKGSYQKSQQTHGESKQRKTK